MQCMGFSLRWRLSLGSTGEYGASASAAVTPGPWSTGSAVVAHGLAAPRHVGSSQTRDWQANSLPLSHQGSPLTLISNPKDGNNLASVSLLRHCVWKAERSFLPSPSSTRVGLGGRAALFLLRRGSQPTTKSCPYSQQVAAAIRRLV